MDVVIHDGYGGFTIHKLEATTSYPAIIYWQGFIYLHRGAGQYYSHPYYFIPPTPVSIEDVR